MIRYQVLSLGFAPLADKLVTLQAIPSCTSRLDRLPTILGPAYATALRVNGKNVLDAIQRQISIKVERGQLIELDVRPLIPAPPIARWLRYLWNTRPGALLLTICRVPAPRRVVAAIICTVDDSP